MYTRFGMFPNLKEKIKTLNMGVTRTWDVPHISSYRALYHKIFVLEESGTHISLSQMKPETFHLDIVTNNHV